MKPCFAVLISIFLLACSGKQDSSGESATDDAAARYQEKVSAKVSDSMMNSFVREWGITQDQAQCVLSNVTSAELMRAESDTDVQARLKKCGVDPEVVK